MKATIPAIPRTILQSVMLFTLLLSCLSLAIGAQEAPAHARHGFRASTNLKSGLYVVVFHTPQGAIALDLPADLRAGDHIYGTITTEPKGRAAAERDPNQAQLDAYTLTLGDRSVSAHESMADWRLPAAGTCQAGWVILKDAQGSEAARADLPIPTAEAAGEPQDRGAANRAGAWQAPHAGQAGRPLTLRGEVTEEPATLHVLIGDKEAPLLAASPRSITVMTPKDTFGKTKLQIKQGDLIVLDGDYRNDRIHGRFNPWPYVIGAVVVVGAVAAISISNSIRHISFGPLPAFE